MMVKGLLKLLGLVLFLLIFFISCEDKPTEIEIDFKPEEVLRVGFVDTISIRTTTYSQDSVRSENTEFSLIGQVQDPIFGSSKANILTQVRLPQVFSPGTNPVVDSIILFMLPYDFYGDTLTEISVEVRESFKRLHVDSIYYSNLNVQDSIGSTVVGTTIARANDTMLVIKIDPSIGEKLLADTLAYSSQEYFLNYFKGLYISTTNATGQGGFLSLYLLSDASELRLYYHDDEFPEASFPFVITSSASRVGLFEHDHSTADPTLKINHLDDGVEDTVIYAQGMSGVYSRIEFPFFDTWIDSMPLAVNEIELEIPLDYTDPTGTDFPKATYYNLYSRNEQGSFERIFDSYLGEDYFGGYIVDSVVRFRVTAHLQDYLERKIDNTEMNLFILNPSLTPSRSVFTSPIHTDRIRLRFTYTRIKE